MLLGPHLPPSLPHILPAGSVTLGKAPHGRFGHSESPSLGNGICGESQTLGQWLVNGSTWVLTQPPSIGVTLIIPSLT